MKHHLKLRDWVDSNKLDWNCLSRNLNAVDLLEKNLDKIRWGLLSSNPNALHLLERNLDKIDWVRLSSNPSAIHLLERNLDKINWMCLSKNPSIFEYDYKSMTKRCNIYEEELIAKRFHHDNYHKFEEWGFDD